MKGFGVQALRSTDGGVDTRHIGADVVAQLQEIEIDTPKTA